VSRICCAFAAPIRSSELSPVKKKQDDTDCGKNECASDPGLSSGGQLTLGLQIIPESGAEKDYRQRDEDEADTRRGHMDQSYALKMFFMTHLLVHTSNHLYASLLTRSSARYENGRSSNPLDDPGER
jgi:hypothetical protein